MSVVPVRDAADRVTEDFDGRLRHVFVVVRRAGLAEVLQQPVFGNAGFNVDFIANPGEGDQPFEDRVGPRSSTHEDRFFWYERRRLKPTQMCVNRSIHRPIERFVRFNSSIE